MKLYGNLELTNNQLVSARVENTGTDPSVNPEHAGRLYINTVDNKLKYLDKDGNVVSVANATSVQSQIDGLASGNGSGIGSTGSPFGDNLAAALTAINTKFTDNKTISDNADTALTARIDKSNTLLGAGVDAEALGIDANYVAPTDATVKAAIQKLDASLKTEETARIQAISDASAASTLQGVYNNSKDKPEGATIRLVAAKPFTIEDDDKPGSNFFRVDPAGDKVVIQGNLEVKGQTISVQTTTTEVENFKISPADNLIGPAVVIQPDGSAFANNLLEIHGTNAGGSVFSVNAVAGVTTSLNLNLTGVMKLGTINNVEDEIKTTIRNEIATERGRIDTNVSDISALTTTVSNNNTTLGNRINAHDVVITADQASLNTALMGQTLNYVPSSGDGKTPTLVSIVKDLDNQLKTNTDAIAANLSTIGTHTSDISTANTNHSNFVSSLSALTGATLVGFTDVNSGSITIAGATVQAAIADVASKMDGLATTAGKRHTYVSSGSAATDHVITIPAGTRPANAENNGYNVTVFEGNTGVWSVVIPESIEVAEDMATVTVKFKTAVHCRVKVLA